MRVFEAISIGLMSFGGIMLLIILALLPLEKFFRDRHERRLVQHSVENEPWAVEQRARQVRELRKMQEYAWGSAALLLISGLWYVVLQ